MKEKTVTLNQCQDCGCPGGEIQVKKLKDFSIDKAWGWAKCPYCGRSTPRIVLEKQEIRPRYDISKVIDAWNSINREYKEGLA